MTFQSNQFSKFTVTAATAVLVATAVAPAASAATFKDVNETSRYKEATDFLETKGVKGLLDGTFGINKNITRADAAVMLANVLELDVEAAPSAGFTDVSPRIEKHVNALFAAEITKGIGNNKFNPNAQITRGELALWLQRAFNLKATSTTISFVDVSDRYTAAVAALVEKKVTNGKTTTLFGTTANATRGEYALFLHRAFLIEDQISALDKAIKEAEQAIAKMLSITDYTEEHWDLLDEVFLKVDKVTDLGGEEEDINNIDAFYDLLSAIFESIIPNDFSDVVVDLASGEVTLTFTDAEYFEEYSFLASVIGTSVKGTVAEELTGTNKDELIITFKPADLNETSTIEVDVSFLNEYYTTYSILNKNGNWTVELSY